MLVDLTRSTSPLARTSPTSTSSIKKLWVALACPTTGLEFDSKTFALIDLDKDGRVRAPAVIAAAKWACGCLKNPDELLKGSAALPFSAINDASPEGRQLLASAKQILANLGKSDAATISLEDATDTVKIFAATKFNGDGIIPAEAAADAALKAVITDIIACLGSEPDRSGKPGTSQAKVDQFFADATAFSDWPTSRPSDDSGDKSPHSTTVRQWQMSAHSRQRSRSCAFSFLSPLAPWSILPAT